MKKVSRNDLILNPDKYYATPSSYPIMLCPTSKTWFTRNPHNIVNCNSSEGECTISEFIENHLSPDISALIELDDGLDYLNYSLGQAIWAIVGENYQLLDIWNKSIEFSKGGFISSYVFNTETKKILVGNAKIGYYWCDVKKLLDTKDYDFSSQRVGHLLQTSSDNCIGFKSFYDLRDWICLTTPGGILYELKNSSDGVKLLNKLLNLCYR